MFQSLNSFYQPSVDFAAQFEGVCFPQPPILQCDVETSMRDFELDEFLRSMHTQTLLPSIDALTQTCLISSSDNSSMTDL